MWTCFSKMFEESHKAEEEEETIQKGCSRKRSTLPEEP